MYLIIQILKCVWVFLLRLLFLLVLICIFFFLRLNSLDCLLTIPLEKLLTRSLMENECVSPCPPLLPEVCICSAICPRTMPVGSLRSHSVQGTQVSKFCGTGIQNYTVAGSFSLFLFPLPLLLCSAPRRPFMQSLVVIRIEIWFTFPLEQCPLKSHLCSEWVSSSLLVQALSPDFSSSPSLWLWNLGTRAWIVIAVSYLRHTWLGGFCILLTSVIPGFHP